ncbi:GMC oxidoreductase [Sandaracinus amylolyticus]|uniref:GMC oxidoreductase n=1 Tax=Sandaracinus amylolyticus TaxID=927083 RepID=UPI001F34074C|nr:GMC oxidoreductase [Sandaracinus amylolyticus]
MEHPLLRNMGRRRFVGTSSAALAGLFAGACGAPTPTVIEESGALIVGSGFGGSIAALRLAEAGIPSLVLERGRRWEITEAGDTFCSLRRPDRRAAWMSERTHIGLVRGGLVPYAGLVERIDANALAVMAAAGVGGGSLVYGGIFMRVPRAIFHRAMPEWISYDEMDSTWYPKVHAVMPARPIPDDVLASDAYRGMRVFLDHAERAGLAPFRVDNAVDWDLVRAELRGEIPPEATVGDYIYGLNSGAKISLDRTYLARAEATGLCQVRALHQVRRIARDPDGRYVAEVERIDEDGVVLEQLRVRAPALVLAAGSTGTTRLLLRARAEGALPMLSDEVGRGWGNNGQSLTVRGRFEEDVGAWQGGPACIFVHDLDNPIGPVTIEHAPAAFGGECHCMIQPSSGVCDELASASWDPQSDRIVIDWHPEYARTARAAAQDTIRRLNEASGAVVEERLGVTDGSTFHPLGGCVIGRATDRFGRVHGYPGLYVLDGSLIPGSTPGANPCFTIAALAERNVDTIVREDFGA